jgi:hypothetical protein
MSSKEFGEFNKVTLLVFPLKEGEFGRELNKLRIKTL